MVFLGLHLLDIIVIVLYIGIVLWIGKKTGEKTSDTEDFYLAGRSLGKFYQFFLNFGNSTNADQAVAVSRETYRMGVGGMWIQFLVLFLTPFYWFTTLFFRRVRLTTIGDFFTERFKSPFLGGSFAAFTLLMAFIGGGVGYMVAAKTIMALTPIPQEKLTIEQRQTIEDFTRYKEFENKIDSGQALSDEDNYDYDILYERNKLGQLKSFYSYIKPWQFYIIYALLVGIYTMMGGFRAAAITDAIQGFLIIGFSIILIPVGLSKIGGFAGLHAKVPDFMFELFGSATLSEYAWYTVFGMVLANLVSIIASAPMMQTAGSAKNEITARLGMIGGMFFKRFLMIFWVLAGLIAIALYANKLHDPDLVWGVMTRDLLAPGLIGLMLVGILAANMSTLDAGSVSNSALFIRNLYQPLLPNKSEKHYLFIGRIAIAVVLLGGIITALYIDNLLDLYKYFISIPAIFGAPIWLGFIWRKLSKPAVIIEVFIGLLIYAIIPNLFPAMQWSRSSENFLKQTQPQTITYSTKATVEDVQNGLIDVPGKEITKTKIIPSTGVFYEKVARQNPDDPNSPLIGVGRFHAEIWVLSWLGIDFTKWKKSELVATRFFFDALFPFLLLFIISFLTRPVEKTVLDRFFAKMHTPVQPTPAQETAALQAAYQNPEVFETNKLFPGSSWEIMKPAKIDYYGFFGSCAVVVLILLVLFWVLGLGA